MAARVQVVKNDFPGLATDLVKKLDAVVEDTAQDVLRDARAASPDYLNIDGKWTVNRRNLGRGVRTIGGVRLQRTVENREWRAVFAEDGTPYVPATPMLRPALERNARKFAQALGEVFGER